MGTVVDFQNHRRRHAISRAMAAGAANASFGTLTDADPLLAAYDHVVSDDCALFTRTSRDQVPELTRRGRRVIPPLLSALGYRELPKCPDHFRRVRSEISSLAGRIVFNDPVTVRDLPALDRS